jgi:hypothetical protein
VGGAFTTAGGLAANRVARYEDGAGWSTLGGGFNGDAVSSLAHDGTYLYAGGSFTTSQGSPVNGVSIFDAGVWTPLGNGADGTVSAVTAVSGTLFAGGYFNTVDGLASYHFGIWSDEPAVSLLPVNVTVFLEGAYSGNDSMSVATTFRETLPDVHPYDGATFDGFAPEYDVTTDPIVVPEGMIDWVIVSLRSGLEAETEVARDEALLFEDGSIRNLDGTAPFVFADVPSGSYRLAVMHRNHLSVMTSDLVPLGGAPATVDLSVLANAYSSDSAPLIQMSDGTYAMFAANGHPDIFVNALDFNVYLAATSTGETGYQQGDFNLDGFVQALDFNLYLKNTLRGAKSQVPN